jgi:guanine deaminase
MTDTEATEGSAHRGANVLTPIIQIAINTAIDEASHNINSGDGVTFGCVIVKNNEIIAKAHNTVLKDKDPTCHGEVNCIRLASKVLDTYDLSGCTLVTTSEPCGMCMTACKWARIRQIIVCANKHVAEKFGFDDVTFENDNMIDITYCSKEIENKIIEMFKLWKENNGVIY